MSWQYRLLATVCLAVHLGCVQAQEDVRLVNGTFGPHMGRVEVLYNGTWGTICDDFWSFSDARVACRMMGFRDAVCAIAQAPFSQGTGPIWMDNLRCSGRETSLEDCVFNGWGINSCTHAEDGGMICATDDVVEPPQTPTLVGSTTTSISLLQWKVPPLPEGITALRFRVQYENDEFVFPRLISVLATLSDNETTYNTTITRLARGTEYTVRVRAEVRYPFCFSYLFGNYSEDLTVSTNETVGTQQVQCFTARSTADEFRCESSDPSFTADNIEECCVQSSAGQFYRQTSGNQHCQACIVFGWFNGSEASTEESGDVTILEVGFIKGALFEEFLQLDRRGELRFLINVAAGTAREGANSDFTVPSGSRSATIRDATIPARIQTLIRVDRIALELPEDFTLSLIGANDAAIATLNAAAPNTFAIPTIRVVIEDRDEAVLQFTESDYSSIEGAEVIRPSVHLLTNIATDLTVVAIPVNYTFVNDSLSPLTYILDVIPDVSDYNPNRPINATSFPFEDLDFSSTQVLITFPAGNAGIQRIDIGIVDDDINEVEQVFVIFLQVVDAVDTARVDLQSGRFATLGIILDDDPLIVGFEQNSYTVFESTGELIRIPVIKGNDQRSELTFSLTFEITTGSGPNAANINQVDEGRGDIIADLVQERVFSPDKQSLAFLFEVLDHSEHEAVEVFQVELSLQESGLNVNLGGMLADGSALYATTQIFIVNDGKELFQIQVGPVEHCVAWNTEKATSLENAIQSALISVIENYYECTFPASCIVRGQFTCLMTQTQVTYRSTIFGTVNHNATQLLAVLQDWVASGPVIKLDWLLLHVSPGCPIHISSMADPECSLLEPQTFDNPTLITSDYGVIQCVNVCLRRTRGRDICGA